MTIKMHSSGMVQHNSKIITKSKGAGKLEPYKRDESVVRISEREMCLRCHAEECDGHINKCRKRFKKMLFSEQNEIERRINTLSDALTKCDPDKDAIAIIEYNARIDELRRLLHVFLTLYARSV